MLIRTTSQFDRWFGGLRDLRSRVRIQAGIDRLSLGHMGDVKPVGQGVFELRIHFGPGFRVYFVEKKGQWIILLAGGDKSTQDRDIVRAHQLAQQL